MWEMICRYKEYESTLKAVVYWFCLVVICAVVGGVLFVRLDRGGARDSGELLSVSRLAELLDVPDPLAVGRLREYAGALGRDSGGRAEGGVPVFAVIKPAWWLATPGVRVVNVGVVGSESRPYGIELICRDERGGERRVAVASTVRPQLLKEGVYWHVYEFYVDPAGDWVGEVRFDSDSKQPENLREMYDRVEGEVEGWKVVVGERVVPVVMDYVPR
jgi:hypothetical protein